ncbi:MAG: hypothetical protein JW993_20470 [Sedimentisphaerales bacterium]|nr:hypothetical protein [Sedimentisphaerales bacterium]
MRRVRILEDSEINALLTERKTLPDNWRTRLKLLPKTDSKHLQRDCEVSGANGNTFRIVLRQSTLNVLDFSIILTLKDKDGNEFRLCRYNGKHPSEHTNRLEKSTGDENARFRNLFHIHMATERYQRQGFEIDGFAEVTKTYSSFDTALEEFLRANGFMIPEEHLPLFDGPGGSK